MWKKSLTYWLTGLPSTKVWDFYPQNVRENRGATRMLISFFLPKRLSLFCCIRTSRVFRIVSSLHSTSGRCAGAHISQPEAGGRLPWADVTTLAAAAAAAVSDTDVTSGVIYLSVVTHCAASCSASLQIPRSIVDTRIRRYNRCVFYASPMSCIGARFMFSRSPCSHATFASTISRQPMYAVSPKFGTLNVKSFPSYKAHRAALISVSLVLGQRCFMTC